MTERLWKGLVAAASVVIVVAGMRAAAPLLVPLVVAALLAIVTFPVVTWLRAPHVPAWMAVLLTLLATLIALLGPGLVVHAAARQFVALAPSYQIRLEEIVASWVTWLQAIGIDTAQWPAMLEPRVVLDLIGSILTGAATVVGHAFLVLLTMGFMLMEAGDGRLRGGLIAAASRFAHLETAGPEIQRYLWIKTWVSLATGLLVGLSAALVGVDFPLIWGLLAFLLNYIPNFGSFLAAVPAVLVALIQVGAWEASVLALFYVAINTVLGNILEPYWMGRRLHLSPLVVLLSLIFWGWVWGAAGLLLAVPITMVIKIALEHSPEARWVALLLGPVEAEVPGRGAREVAIAPDAVGRRQRSGAGRS
jgi:AI-2 transport protein TqsA